MKKVTIYTDGACAGNPGPGGWSAILVCDGVEEELSGGKADTTNDEMELTAATTSRQPPLLPPQGWRLISRGESFAGCAAG